MILKKLTWYKLLIIQILFQLNFLPKSNSRLATSEKAPSDLFFSWRLKVVKFVASALTSFLDHGCYQSCLTCLSIIMARRSKHGGIRIVRGRPQIPALTTGPQATGIKALFSSSLSLLLISLNIWYMYWVLNID